MLQVHSKGIQLATYMYLFFFQIIFPLGFSESLFDVPLCSHTAPPPQLANACPGLLFHEAGGRREPGRRHWGGLPGTRAPGTSEQLDWAASGLVSLWGWSAGREPAQKVGVAGQGSWESGTLRLEFPSPPEPPASPSMAAQSSLCGGHWGNASCFWARVLLSLQRARHSFNI